MLSAITDQSQAEVETIKESALSYADQKREETEQALASYRAELERKAKIAEEDLCAKRRIDANLEARKILLDAKRDILSRVYRKVMDKLLALDPKATLSLIDSLLVRYADKGDVVLLADGGKAELYEVSTLPVCKERGLTVKLDKEVPNGFVLESAGFRRDFSYDALVKEVQEKSEMQLSKRLFD